jgi:hypothetical protein
LYCAIEILAWLGMTRIITPASTSDLRPTVRTQLDLAPG